MRNKILILLAFIFVLPLSAAPTHLELSPEQENEILSSLNNVCGDTWCAGEFNLNFTSIKLSDASGSQYYVIDLLVQSSYDDGATITQLNCNVADLQLIQQLANRDGNVSHETLEQQLYHEVDNCLVQK